MCVRAQMCDSENELMNQKNCISLSFRSELYKSKIILQLRAAVRFQISVRKCHQMNVVNIY